MDDWENWEEAAEKDVQEVKKDNKFADEEAEAVDIDAKDETKIKSQPKNPEKVIHFFWKSLNECAGCQERKGQSISQEVGRKGKAIRRCSR